MSHRSTVFAQALFVTTFFVLGCSKGGSLGCSGNGSDGSSADQTAQTAGGAAVDSSLPGVYAITRYEGSVAACDQLAAIPSSPAYLVLYSFKPDRDTDEARLGGAFCDDVGQCRSLANEAAEPAIGYSFISGDDAEGWQGWAITGTGPEEEQCGADVQSHRLAMDTGAAVRIETKTVRTLFPPVVDGEIATCHNKDAIASVNDNLPCTSLVVLEATKETGL